MKKQVIAIAMGFIDGVRRRPGDVFDVDAKASAAWFQDYTGYAVPVTQAEAKPASGRRSARKPAAESVAEPERNVI